MPGISILYKSDSFHEQDFSIDFLDYESHFNSTVIYRDDHLMIAGTVYDAYPLKIMDTENNLACIEGFIYNQSEEAVGTAIRSIIRAINENRDHKKIILDFIKASYGEFIVYIYDKNTGRLVVFTDKWSRLKTFYYHDRSSLIISREHTFVLKTIPAIALNRNALAEFLALEYTLDNKTLLNRVFKSHPAFYLSGEYRDDKIQVSTAQMITPNFTTVSKPPSRKESLIQCLHLYLEALSHLDKKMKREGFQITADLSGGYDSRAVFFGLIRCGIEAKYFTDYLSTGDESSYARKVAELYGKNITTVRATQLQTDKIDELSRISYLTGCNVNAFTAVFGYRDAEARKKLIQNKSVKFGGFGGEYIRHPYRHITGYSSIAAMLNDGVFIRGVSLRDAAGLIKSDEKTLVRHFQKYFDTYGETSVSDRVKHFYFDYYNNLVNMGEDRSRIHFWTIQPLLSDDLLLYYNQKIPRKYIGTKYFISFMKNIDPKSLNAPIYKSKIKLQSKANILCFELSEKIDHLIRNNIVFKKFSKRFKHFLVKKTKAGFLNRESSDLILKILNTSEWVRKYLDEKYIQQIIERSSLHDNLKPLMTVMLYMKEVEKKHGNKIK